MVSIKTATENVRPDSFPLGLIDTVFNPTQFSMYSIFKSFKNKGK
jgi:hypothetical protein